MKDIVSTILDKGIAYLNNKVTGTIISTDHTNPTMAILETGATMAADAMLTNVLAIHNIFPDNSVSKQELLQHINNVDTMKLATPSRAIFTIYINVNDIMMQGIEYATDEYIVTIPKYTTITVEDNTKFTIVNDIEIRYKRRSTIKSSVQMLIDAENQDSNNDLSNLRSLIITDDESTDWLVFDTTADQIDILETEGNILAGNVSINTIDLNGLFYKADVFVKQYGSDNYIKYRTTFTKNAYNLQNEMALLELDGLTLTVTLLNTISSNNSLGGKILIRVYTTMGYLELPLDKLEVDDFELEFGPSRDIQSASGTRRINTKVLSFMNLRSGDNGDSFTTLTQRIIYNSIYNPDNYISLSDLRLNRQGFSVREAVGLYSTEFIVSKSIRPTTLDPIVHTDLFNGLSYIDTHDVSRFKDIVIIDDKLTIKSGATFMVENDRLKPLTEEEYNNAVYQIGKGNDSFYNKYFFSPFFYTSQLGNNNIPANMYYLEPSMRNFYIDGLNSTDIKYRANIDKLHIVRNGSIFTMLFTLIVNDTVETDMVNLKVQVSVPIADSNEFISYPTIYDSVNKMYSVEIETDFEFVDDKISIINGHKLIENTLVALDSSIKVIVYFTNEYILNEFYVNDEVVVEENAIALSKQFVFVKFGDKFENIETSVYDSSDIPIYKRYTQDIPLVYPEDVFYNIEEDIDVYNLEQHNPQFEVNQFINIKHKKGEQVIDEYGNQVYKHSVNDVILDTDGEPIIIGVSNGYKNMSLMVYQLEAKLTNVDNTHEQINMLKNQIDMVDVPDMLSKCLENTSLKFTPPYSIAKVFVNNLRKYISSFINPSIRIFTRDNNFSSNIDMEQLKVDIGIVIENEILNGSNIVIYDLSERIKNTTLVGKNVLSVGITLSKELDGAEIVDINDKDNKLYISRKIVNNKLTFNINIEINVLR